MPSINISHLRNVSKALLDRVPQKAAETAQSAAKDASKQARDAASSRKAAEEAAAQAESAYNSAVTLNTDTKTAASQSADKAKEWADYAEKEAKAAEDAFASAQKAISYRGSVDNYADLPALPHNGDMYNIVNADSTNQVKAGDNVVWNGTDWDNLSGYFELPKELVSKIVIGDEEQTLDNDRTVTIGEISDEDIRMLTYGMMLDNSKYSMRFLFPSEYRTMTEVPELDTSKVTNMTYMFAYCNALVLIPEINTNNVTNMSAMFYDCNALTSIPELDTGKVTSMDSMFVNCKMLASIPWEIDMNSCTSYGNAFKGCTKLTGVKLKNVPKDFNATTAGLTDGQYTIVSYRES